MADDGIFQGDGHVDEGAIHGWIEEQLDATSASRIAAHVAGCAECEARVAEARGLIAGASRVLSSLDRVAEPRIEAPVVAGVRPVDGVNVQPVDEEDPAVAGTIAPARRAVASRRSRPAWLAAAAAVVLMVGSAYMWERISGDDLAVVPLAERSSVALESPPAPPVAVPMPASEAAPEVPAHLRGSTAGGAAAPARGVAGSALAAAPPRAEADGAAPALEKVTPPADAQTIESVVANPAAVATTGDRVPSTGEVAARAAAQREVEQRGAASEAFRGDRTTVAAAPPPMQQRVLRRAAPGRGEQPTEAAAAGPVIEPISLAEIVAGCYEATTEERERMELLRDGQGRGAAGAWWAAGRDTIEVAWAAGGSVRFEIRAAGDTLVAGTVIVARVSCR